GKKSEQGGSSDSRRGSRIVLGSLLLNHTALPASARSGARDARLDFFRGLALIFIFIDHVPGNVFANLTFKNFGFADAAEIFIFISGYAAALAFGRSFERDGFGALALNHHLIYLNILPLYIVLLAWFPVLFWLIRRHPALALAASVAIYGAARLTGLNLPSYPNDDGWFFNPFAWQLLFSVGALLGHAATRGIALPRSPWLTAGAALYAVFALIVIAPWTKLPGLEDWRLLPGDLLAPMDKSGLSPWRLAHILAVAYLVAILVNPKAAWL